MNTRHQAILEALQEGREARVAELARRLAVAPMTIRRDLAELAAEGRLVRTHGGAAAARPSVVEFAFLEKSRECGAEKRAIAEVAAGRVGPGQTVVLDTGTTTLEVARRLRDRAGLTILTTSLAIAAALFGGQPELILLGGAVRRGSPDLAGPLAEENLRGFKVDLAILGADGVAPDGPRTSDLAVARLSRAMLETAGRAMLVADHRKFQQRALVRIAPWDRFHEVVTDGGLAREARRWLARAGPLVHSAEVKP